VYICVRVFVVYAASTFYSIQLCHIILTLVGLHLQFLVVYSCCCVAMCKMLFYCFFVNCFFVSCFEGWYLLLWYSVSLGWYSVLRYSLLIALTADICYFSHVDVISIVNIVVVDMMSIKLDLGLPWLVRMYESKLFCYGCEYFEHVLGLVTLVVKVLVLTFKYHTFTD
jgi:hypothetical protein